MMAVFHRCRKCGAKYECIARFCPQCGDSKPRSNAREQRPVVMKREDFCGETIFRCSGCGRTTEFYMPRYCPSCGAKVREVVE